MNALVSCIIPTYKRSPEMVKRAAESILNQTYKDIELIIVDDSPEDFEQRKQVKQMIESLNGNVRYIQHEKNMGGCAARNTGISYSEGEFVAFLDDDDEWIADKLEKQLKLFENSDVGLVYCRQYVIDTASGKSREIKKEMYRGKVYEKLLAENFIGSTSFVVMRKSYLMKTTLFDTEMESVQDADMWVRMSKICECDYVDEPLVKYYVHSGDRISGSAKKKISGLERFYEKYFEDIVKDDSLIWRDHLTMATMYAWDRKYLTALSRWIKAVMIKPGKVLDNMSYFKHMLGFARRSLRKR